MAGPIRLNAQAYESAPHVFTPSSPQVILARTEPVSINADSHSVMLIGFADFAPITAIGVLTYKFYRCVSDDDPTNTTLGAQIGPDMISYGDIPGTQPGLMCFAIDPDPPGGACYALTVTPEDNFEAGGFTAFIVGMTF